MGEGEGQPGGQAHPGDGHNAHASGRGKDHHHSGTGPGTGEDRQEECHSPEGTQPGSQLRGEGRGSRRRLFPGSAHGGHQPSFHRRHPRSVHRPQSSERPSGQPPAPGQRAWHRPQASGTEASHGHEREGLKARSAGTGRQAPRSAPGNRDSTSPWPARSWPYCVFRGA